MAQAEEIVATGQCQKPREPKRSEWLVMIYLAGDNNLSANSLAILQELEKAHHSEEVRVLACFDSNTPRPRGARYFEIRRHRHSPQDVMDWALHDDLIPFECIPGHPVQAPDFCNPQSNQTIKEPEASEGLSRFLNFALDPENYLANKHMLILFGHGSAVAGNTFLADDNPPSFVRLKDFARILGEHFHRHTLAGESAGDDEESNKKKPVLNILACDNCMMNGIESAFEIRKHVDYVIGSQGLMLALGWPFRKIIEAIHRHPRDVKAVARHTLEACARNLIDFVLMDRSSEQSLCDLTTLRKEKNLVTAVKELSRAMQEGLEWDECGVVRYPAVRDAIRLARLEAQSYWNETFVDLYDFCALLHERCKDAIYQALVVFYGTRPKTPEPATESIQAESSDDDRLHGLAFLGALVKIVGACESVMGEIKLGKEPPAPQGAETGPPKFVVSSYYVGPELQYSNGVSIYFPWALPEQPIIFEPVEGRGGAGRYGVSWTTFARVAAATQEAKARIASGYEPPKEFVLKTAFDEYETYDFAQRDGGDWSAFLRTFFHATLRNVRRFEANYFQSKYPQSPPIDLKGFFDLFDFRMDVDERLFDPGPVNTQKSSSDVDSETPYTYTTIKNYPHRFYVSPADCLRRCDITNGDECKTKDDHDKEPCVSYLGWNVRGITAEVIKLKKHSPKRSDQSPEGSDDQPTGESRES